MYTEFIHNLYMLTCNKHTSCLLIKSHVRACFFAKPLVHGFWVHVCLHISSFPESFRLESTRVQVLHFEPNLSHYQWIHLAAMSLNLHENAMQHLLVWTFTYTPHTISWCRIMSAHQVFAIYFTADLFYKISFTLWVGARICRCRFYPVGVCRPADTQELCGL